MTTRRRVPPHVPIHHRFLILVPLTMAVSTWLLLALTALSPVDARRKKSRAATLAEFQAALSDHWLRYARAFHLDYPGLAVAAGKVEADQLRQDQIGKEKEVGSGSAWPTLYRPSFVDQEPLAGAAWTAPKKIPTQRPLLTPAEKAEKHFLTLVKGGEHSPGDWKEMYRKMTLREKPDDDAEQDSEAVPTIAGRKVHFTSVCFRCWSLESSRIAGSNTVNIERRGGRR